jgi:hypothetical protein
MIRFARPSRRTRLASRAALLLTMALATGSAGAAVSAPHVIAALANSSSLELSEYPPGTMITTEVVRTGAVVGGATGLVDVDGTFNVNPTHCWTDVTPVILPGDIVRVRPADPEPQTWVDETVVQNVTVDSIHDIGGVVTVKGTAAKGDGTQFGPDEIQNRLISRSGSFTKTGTKRLRTGHVGVTGEGTIAYDEPGTANVHWTATYAGLVASDIALALASDVRGIWAPAVATPQEVTIMILGAQAAPAAPCVAPVALNAVIHATPNTISIANVDDVVLNGVSLDATRIDVKLDDDDPATAPLNQSVSPSVLGQQAWTVTFPKADVAGLTDGLLKATGTYFSGLHPGGIPGQDLVIAKDMIAPAKPTATPGPGTYTETQAVQLQHSDVTGSRIVYTTDGSDPTALSSIAVGQVFVTSSLTLKARVTDAVGNLGSIESFGYTIDRSLRSPDTTQSSGGKHRSASAAAPVFSRVRTTCVPIGAHQAKLRARCRAGVSFSLSIAAQVTVVVRNARGRIVGSFVRSAVAGPNTVALPSRLRGRALRPGRYRLALTAIAGGMRSTKASASLKLPQP